MIRLVQLTHPRHGRRVAVADDRQLRFIQPYGSIYVLAKAAISTNKSLADTVNRSLSNETLDYDPIHRGESEWKFLPAFDHPEEPTRCLVTGTGLTHKASAENRQAMHAGENGEKKPPP